MPKANWSRRICVAQTGSVAVLATMAWLAPVISFAGNVGAPSPTREIDVTTLGFTPAYFESNRKFFKNYSVPKLMASDPESKLIMLSENMAVLYATRSSDGIAEHRPDCLHAFFIDVSTGELVRRQEWHVNTRRLDSDHFDSEARIIPLSAGRYLVMAERKILVYETDGTLSKTRVLSDGIWAAKSVSNGEVVFLRKSEWPGNVAVRYEWLDGGTLETQHRFEDTDSVRVQMPYSAASDSVTFAMRDGLHQVMFDGTDHRVICTDRMCRFPADVGANWEVIGQRQPERLIFVSPEGLLVAFVPDGQGWSRLTGYSGSGPVSLHIALLGVSQSGNRWVLLLNGKHKIFDDVQLQGDWQYAVYDVEERHPVLVAPQLSVSGDVHEALSPSGRKLLTFDGKVLRVYSVP